MLGGERGRGRAVKEAANRREGVVKVHQVHIVLGTNTPNV